MSLENNSLERLFSTTLNKQPIRPKRSCNICGRLDSTPAKGGCWWYRKYAPGDTVLEGLEKDAREAKKGLWQDPQPTPPLALANAAEEGPKPMDPSLVEIFNALEAAKEWAQVWAQLNPDYDYRAYKFIQDLDQIGRELSNSVNGETSLRSSRHSNTVEASSWHYLFIMIARGAAFAERFSQQHPEYTVPLKRYEEEVHRAVTELLEKAGPGRPTD